MTTDKKSKISIDAAGIYYRDLNAQLREVVKNGTEKIELLNVCGQRYLATDLEKPVDMEIFGTPGNDLGAFMNGTRIIVHGNAQDCTGNTMNDGEIIIHGHAGDIIGLSARGGRIFVRESVNKDYSRYYGLLRWSRCVSWPISRRSGWRRWSRSRPGMADSSR